MSAAISAPAHSAPRAAARRCTRPWYETRKGLRAFQALIAILIQPSPDGLWEPSGLCRNIYFDDEDAIVFMHNFPQPTIPRIFFLRGIENVTVRRVRDPIKSFVE